MQKLSLTLALLIATSFPAFSQMNTTKDSGSMNSTKDSGSMNSNMDSTQPKAGANSFTEAQAKDRITKAGYSSVDALTKTPEGYWTGPAMKQGKQVTVMMDFKGNITDQ